MLWLAGTAMVVALCVIGSLAGTGQSGAQIIVAINKSKQRMTVLVDGIEQHLWKISTGLGGGPPSGTYHPERLERKWFSRKYGWSPMPHSIFFHKGYAIHGTIHISRLGKRASHGCVRLHPAHAAALFDLVRRHGMGNTVIVVANSDIPVQRNLPHSADVPAPAGAPQASPIEPATAVVPGITGAVPASPALITVPAIEE